MHGVCLRAGKRSLHGYPAGFLRRVCGLPGVCAAFDSMLTTGSRPCREGASVTLATRSIDPVWQRRATRRVVKTDRNLLCHRRWPDISLLLHPRSMEPLPTIRRHRKNPVRHEVGGGKFWGKQIEMAVSPCRYGLEWGSFGG